MFITIQPHQRDAEPALLDATYHLRKRVFHDRLRWNVEIDGERERDRYDGMGATTLVWCDAERETLYGSVRLMPLDGPTLLRDVFGATQAADPLPHRRDVWEGTRMCVDEEAIARDLPWLDAGRGFGLLLLALCEAALAHNIHRLVSNFEAPVVRVYRRAGLRFHLHGEADGYGARPVRCGSFAVDPNVLSTMRAQLGVMTPIFTRGEDFAPLVPTPLPAEPARAFTAHSAPVRA